MSKIGIYLSVTVIFWVTMLYKIRGTGESNMLFRNTSTTTKVHVVITQKAPVSFLDPRTTSNLGSFEHVYILIRWSPSCYLKFRSYIWSFPLRGSTKPWRCIGGMELNFDPLGLYAGTRSLRQFNFTLRSLNCARWAWGWVNSKFGVKKMENREIIYICLGSNSDLTGRCWPP